MDKPSISNNPLAEVSAPIPSLEGRYIKEHFGEYLQEVLTPKQYSKIEDYQEYTSLSHVFRTLIDGSILDNILKYYIDASSRNIHYHVLYNIFDAIYYGAELLFQCLVTAQKEGLDLPHEELIDREFVETVKDNYHKVLTIKYLNAISHSLAHDKKFFNFNVFASVSRRLLTQLIIVPTKDGKQFNMPFEMNKLFGFSINSSNINTGNLLIGNLLVDKGYPLKIKDDPSRKITDLRSTLLHEQHLLGEHHQFNADIRGVKNTDRGLVDFRIRRYNSTLFTFSIATLILAELGFTNTLGAELLDKIIEHSKGMFENGYQTPLSLTEAIMESMNTILKLDGSPEAYALFKLTHVIELQFDICLYNIKFY